jgi:inosose dehydratase
MSLSQTGSRPLSRRGFIGAAGALLGAAALGGCATVSRRKDTALVGSNIYGWGQYARRENRPLDPPAVMDALKASGYDYLEGFLNLDKPEENALFANQLREHGLQPVSLYVGPALHSHTEAARNVQRVLAAAEICQDAGFETLSCNPAAIGRSKTAAELETQAAALADLGMGLKSLGMKLGIHHHLPEMGDGAREFHSNFQRTHPSLVGWCYDVHWVWKGGLMPLDALKQYGDRVVTWHLRQSRENVWWEDLDTGDIDYHSVAAYARQHRLPRRYTVELALEPTTKITRSAVENHRRSREFVRKVFGV